MCNVYIGLPYTWFNNRTHLGTDFLSLDRAVENQRRLNLYDGARIENLAIAGFTHGPILQMMDYMNWTCKYPILYLKKNGYDRKAYDASSPNLKKIYWTLMCISLDQEN